VITAAAAVNVQLLTCVPGHHGGVVETAAILQSTMYRHITLTHVSLYTVLLWYLTEHTSPL
jgi:hypothetical protein